MKLLKVIVMFLVIFAALCTPKIASANASEKPTDFEFFVDGKSIKFSSFDICQNKEILEKWSRNAGGEAIKKVADKILKMGFSNTVCAQFLFPGMEEIFDTLEKKVNSEPQNATIKFSSGKPVLQKEIYGTKFSREETAKQLLENLQNGTNKIHVVTKKTKPNVLLSDISNCTNIKSRFSTWCGNSSFERKNNIRVAIEAINNSQVLPGETFSFNNATGIRTEEKGYKKAKIIQNGRYVEGTGGGVCQVSTTLYNAALLAGLDVKEAHQHSLAVSYVEPSRDAMVNGNSADLKFTNNTDKPIFINALFVNDESVVIKIYGQKNESTFSVESNVIKVIDSAVDEVSSNKDLAPFELKRGETYRISYPKNGIESESFLIEKDKNGNIIKQTKLRHNKYNPTNGVVVIG